jgi:nickel transport protein
MRMRFDGFWKCVTECPRVFALLAVVIVWCWCFPGVSYAHKIRVFAWIAGDTVTVESGFSGGRPLVAGSVEVQDAATGNSLLQGKTNDGGVFTFSLAKTIKQNGVALRIIVSGGEGHQNEWLLETKDHQGGAGVDTTVAAAPTPSLATPVPADQANIEHLTRIFDQLLEEKLAPIRRSLAQAEEQKPKFTDILGGIGYIVGIAGIIAWMKSRK